MSRFFSFLRKLLSFSVFENQPSTLDQEENGYMEAEPWILDKVEITDDALQIQGWALPPLSSMPVKFLVNGQPFESIDYPIQSSDVAVHFPQRSGAECSRFLGKIPIDKAELLKGGYFSLKFTFSGQSEKFPFHFDWCFPNNDIYPPLPENHRIYRVIGSDRTDMFLLGGCTDFNKIENLLKALFGKSYTDFQSILDWGVGAGRVARYFSHVPNVKFYGADVDPDNILWCQQNLIFGDFQQIPLMPPTAFEPNTFDLVYGISVFTHLHEDVQFAWLEELQRITAPGAILLMTFHGITTMNFAGIPSLNDLQSLLSRIEENGFVITSSNDQINDVIDQKDYYINVAHSKTYIREKWSKYFEVIDIIPGFIATHDLVVLRRG